MDFGSTENRQVTWFPRPLRSLAYKAKAECVKLYLPQKTDDGDARRFAGYLDLKALQMSPRERLVALRNMQERFPIGERVTHKGITYIVEGVIPTVKAADCDEGVPPPERMFTLRLIGPDGILERVGVANLEQEWSEDQE